MFVDVNCLLFTERSQQSPAWIQYKGRWGNPKSKCHPLKRIGLHFCEYADGPTGIPLKESHFQCSNSQSNLER